MELPEEFRDFLDYISVEKGLSANTQLAYHRDLVQFFEFCRIKKKEPLSVSMVHLRQYLSWLNTLEVSTRSSARKLSTLKQFFKFLLREGKLQEDPSELLSIHLKPRKLPKTLSIKEMKRLVESAGGGSESGVRDRALLEFWYATGSRISEIAGLTVANIDWKQGVVKFKGKGNKERLVPLHSQAIEWGKKYQKVRHEWVRRLGLVENENFFLTLRGKPFTRQGIWKMLKTYARKAQIPFNVWPHMIRHSFATHILNGGADLREVQELLGHQSISTTEIYTHLDTENLKVMQLKYHPRS